MPDESKDGIVNPGADQGASGGNSGTTASLDAADPSKASGSDAGGGETELNTLKSRIDAADSNYKSLNDKLDTIFSRLAPPSGQPTAGAAPPVDAVTEDDLTLMLSNPKAYKDKLKAELAREVTGTVFSAQERERLATEIIAEYPDVKNEKSDFYKEVDVEYRQIARRLGVTVVGEPNIVKLACDAVDRRRVKKTLASRSTEPNFPADSPGAAASGRVNNSASGFRITDDHRELGSALGFSDKDLAEIYKDSK